MSFPALALKSGGVLEATATGVPTNGVNVFAHNILAGNINSNWSNVQVIANGASVTGCTFVSIDATNLTLNFTQSGTDTATVRLVITYSAAR